VQSVPILVILLSSLAAIIILNRITHSLIAAVIAGAVVFAVWVGLSPREMVMVLVDSFFSAKTIGLLLLLFVTITLSNQMQKSESLEALVKIIRNRCSTRFALAALPAVIGLLPMPGGALFSAPFLDAFTDVKVLDATLKTRINYWFRHVWEYWWFLYAGILVASAISGIPLWQYSLASMPVSLFAIAAGWFFILRKIPNSSQSLSKKDKLPWSGILRPLLPIIVVVAVYAGAEALVPARFVLTQYQPIILGVVLAMILLQAMHPLPLRDWAGMVKNRKTWGLVLLILVIEMYGRFIGASVDGVPIVSAMAQEMAVYGIPWLPLALFIPFVAGAVMAASVGFSGTTFPVVVALLGVNPALSMLLPVAIASYVTGFMGVMLSPLHVCLMATCEYYGSQYHKVMKGLLLPLLLVWILSMGYLLVLHFFL